MAKSGFFGAAALGAVLAVLALGLSGCPRPVPTKSVRGYAMLDAPLAGATVRVVNAAGEEICRAAKTTGERGTFYLNIPEAHAAGQLLIEATGGGSVEKGAFTGVLRALVEEYDEAHSFYELNPVTTLAAAFYEAHPEYSYAEAEAAVREFLELPDHVSILNDLSLSHAHFVPELFMEELELSGDWDAFFELLLDELDNPDGDNRPFTWHALYPAQGMGGEKGAVGTLAKDLLKGIAPGIGGKIGGMVVGWALDAIGLGGGEDPSVSPAQFQSGMEDLKRQIDGVRQSVTQLQSQLNADVQLLLVGQEQVSFNTAAALLTQDVAVVKSLQERLSWLADAELDGQDSLDADVRDFIQRIDDADLLTLLNHTHAVLTGAVPGQQGLLELWGDILFAKSYSTKHFDQLGDQLAYWMNIQVQALYLLIESDHYHYPARPRYSAQYLDVYLDNMADQVELYYQAVEKQITLFRRLDETPAAASNFNGFDGTVSPYTVSYHSENHNLFDAQNLAAAALNQQGGTVIWVQMLSYYYLYEWGNFPATSLRGPGAAALQLRNTTTGQVYKPQKATFQTVDQKPWMPNLVINPGAGDFTTQVGRYDFGTLPPGRYQLTDSFNNAFPHTPRKPLPATYLNFVINVDTSTPIHNMLILFGGYSLLLG